MKHKIVIPKCKGVYVLVLKVTRDTVVHTRSKTFDLTKGYYVYVGSARGLGGVSSRIRRYIYGLKKAFWHIDYLLVNPVVSLKALCFKCSDVDLESFYASEFRRFCLGFPGFGCSDKPLDYSHLYLCGGSLREVYLKIKSIDKSLNCLNISLKNLVKR